MEVEEKWYKVNGIRLQVMEAGDQQGPVLMFLHGFPEFWWGWHKQISYFAAKGYRVIVPNQRGYHQSSKPKDIRSYRIQHLADDVTALIEQHKSRQVVLIGHDWGGAVAWAVAMRFPQLLSKLVILNMPHPQVMKTSFKHWPKQLLKSWYIAYFQLPMLPELSLRLFNFRLLANSLQRSSRSGTFSTEELERYKAAWRQPGALRAMLHWYRAIRYQSEPLFQQEISVPTLLIWGKQDQFLSHEMAKASIDMCRYGKLVMIEAASHWVHHEEAELVNALIHKFSEGK